MVQLVERSHLTPEICGSSPDIGKILSTSWTKNNRIDVNKEKEAENGPSKKKFPKSLYSSQLSFSLGASLSVGTWLSVRNCCFAFPVEEDKII